MLPASDPVYRTRSPADPGVWPVRALCGAAGGDVPPEERDGRSRQAARGTLRGAAGHNDVIVPTRRSSAAPVAPRKQRRPRPPRTRGERTNEAERRLQPSPPHAGLQRGLGPARARVAMAFKFSWGNFDDAVLAMARKELNQALNKGKKPSVIVGDINVKTLHLGTQVRLTACAGKRRARRAEPGSPRFLWIRRPGEASRPTWKSWSSATCRRTASRACSGCATRAMPTSS